MGLTDFFTSSLIVNGQEITYWEELPTQQLRDRERIEGHEEERKKNGSLVACLDKPQL